MGQVYKKVGTETRYREEEVIVEQDVGFEDITICRPKVVFFEFEGLKPSTPHWIYLDKTDVTNYVNTSAITSRTAWDNLDRNSDYKNPGDKYVDATAFPTALGGPTAASGPINSSSTGSLKGLLYVQSNDTLSFPTGVKVITAMDVSVLDKTKSLSYAQSEFVAHGLYELYTEVESTQTVAYEADIFDWVNVPDPPRPANNNSNDDRGSSEPTFKSHYEPSTNTVTYFDEPQTHAQIQARRKAAGGTFNKSLGGGKDGGGGGSGSSQSSKIVCTAMNNAYGFGGFRNAIWLKYASDHLTKEHEVGYHTIFMPLVERAYNRGDKNNMFLRKVLEHIARHRSADIRAELRNGKRDKIGRIQRAFFEPLCYIVGKIKMRKQ